MSNAERPNPVDFGRHLKAALVLADTTAAELASQVGPELEIGLATIERVMQGRRAPRRWEVPRFAEALGVSPDFLLYGPGGDIRAAIEVEAAQGNRERSIRQADELRNEVAGLREAFTALQQQAEEQAGRVAEALQAVVETSRAQRSTAEELTATAKDAASVLDELRPLLQQQKAVVADLRTASAALARNAVANSPE